MIGGLIMVHGDDDGLRVPPRIATVQVVVLAIKPEAVALAAALSEELKVQGVRAVLDDRTDIPFGRRAVDWELKGVPLRIELGPRDLEAEQVGLVERISGNRRAIALRNVTSVVTEALDSAQHALLAAAAEFRDGRVDGVRTVAEAVECCQAGRWARVPWSVVSGDGERDLAAAGITVRCLQNGDGSVPVADDDTDLIALLARAY